MWNPCVGAQCCVFLGSTLGITPQGMRQLLSSKSTGTPSPSRVLQGPCADRSQTAPPRPPSLTWGAPQPRPRSPRLPSPTIHSPHRVLSFKNMKQILSLKRSNSALFYTGTCPCKHSLEVSPHCHGHASHSGHEGPLPAPPHTCLSPTRASARTTPQS